MRTAVVCSPLPALAPHHYHLTCSLASRTGLTGLTGLTGSLAQRCLRRLPPPADDERGDGDKARRPAVCASSFAKIALTTAIASSQTSLPAVLYSRQFDEISPTSTLQESRDRAHSQESRVDLGPRNIVTREKLLCRESERA